jgi:hypothetical protein
VPPAQTTRRYRLGGKRAVVQCFDPSLTWLIARQDADGRWDADGFMRHEERGAFSGGGGLPGDGAVTGLALLALLGDGSTLRSGPHKAPIKRAVRWLIEQQAAPGGLCSDAGFRAPCHHAIATLALCEAFGMSRYRSLREPVQRAVDRLGSLRVADDAGYGNWPLRDRLVLLGWSIKAFGSATEFGLRTPPDAIASILASLDRYRRADPIMVAALELTCRLALRQDPAQVPAIEVAAKLLGDHPPVWDKVDLDLDRCCFAAYALYRLGGARWKLWSSHLCNAIVKTQRLGAGNARGSWDPVGPGGAIGGRVYSTAIGALSQQVFYRYSQLVR